MIKKKYYVNPYIFFLIEKNKLCLWNYKDHEQYEIDSGLMRSLEQILNGNCENNIPYEQELLENNIISETPYQNDKWGWDRLSHIFHFGTQNVPELTKQRSKKEMIADFLGFAENFDEKRTIYESIDEDNSKKYLSTNFMKLGSLEDALKNRMTSRSFSGKTISFEEFSTILKHTFLKNENPWGDLAADIDFMGTRKTSPSAGGLHSVQAYVTVFNVEKLNSGLYIYDDQKHSLKFVHDDLSIEKMIFNMADQFYMDGLSFGVFLVSNLKCIWKKYLHSRSYREIFLDSGHLSQTMQLVATSLGLNTWLSGYFRDEEVKNSLRLSNDKIPILYIGVGKGEKTPIHNDMLEIVKDNDKKQ